MNQAHTLQPMPSTRERLLHTARDLFSTHGYQSTSLRDLATQLGVQPGSIYNHIENKQSLLFELMEEAMDDLLDQTRLGLKRRNTKLSKLSLFVQAFVTFQSCDPKRLALIDREIINLSCAQRERITILRQEYAQCLMSVINTEVAGANLPTSRMLILARAIIGMLQSLALYCQDDFNDSPLEVDELTNIIIGAIAAAKR